MVIHTASQVVLYWLVILARQFFASYNGRQESYYHEELTLLKSLNTVQQAQSSDLVDMYRYVKQAPQNWNYINSNYMES